MTISIEQIKSLREKTGVSTMACKKALVEANGDEEKAIEILRKKGEAKAASRADRTTENGAVLVAKEGEKTAMLALGCETDFVAKNDDFLEKARAIAAKLARDGEEADLSSELNDLNLQMGEKIEEKGRKVFSGNVSTYIHGNNKIGVLVQLSGDNDELGKDIAMHVAAMNPAVISPDEVSDELVAKEKDVWKEQLLSEGKPEAIIGKIMEGKEAKFRKEGALLSQAFVKNPDQSVSDLLDGLSIEAFVRFAV